MKTFSAKAFKAEKAWGSSLLSDFGDVTVRLHWTDQPYRWHRNTGNEVFAVLEGMVDMHYRQDGEEHVVRLHPGDGVSVENGDEHVAHPVGQARILVVERKDSGMTRLSAAFAKGHPALITFVTAGDPTPRATPAILDALVAGGADVIELGMPFTDPMADGPAIQAANLRSLAAGTKTADILNIARAFRQRHPETPLVLMGYANPMTIRGADWFATAAKDAGVDGVICVDIPPEEDEELGPALRAVGIDLIRLATPTTDAARLPTVLGGASGFLYYVSVAGITGLQQAAQSSIEDAVAKLKAATDIPVAVGFGVRTPEQAAAIATVADGVVVGSAIVELVARHGADAPGAVTAYIQSLSSAIRAARMEEVQ